MNSADDISILICTGATGGHFYPALSVAETFRRRYPQVKIHFLMNKVLPFAQEEMANREMSLHVVEWSGLKRSSFFGIFSFFPKLIKALFKTNFLMRKVKPRLIIGFGSYSSVLGVLLGVVRGIPALLHEQNASAGKANEFLGFWVKRIAVSFPETLAVWPKENVFCSGYPVRNAFLNLRQDDAGETDGKKFHILVLGGSQGARKLNRIVCEAISCFPLSEKENLAVTHSIGSDDCLYFEKRYRDFGIKSEVFEFSKEMDRYFGKADLVIARAGAGTIFELAATGKPAVLIPYPYAGAHQKVNAEYLVERQMAEMIEEVDLTPLQLYKSIRSLMKNPQKCQKMGDRIQNLHRKNAGEEIVEEGWKLICGKI